MGTDQNQNVLFSSESVLAIGQPSSSINVTNATTVDDLKAEVDSYWTTLNSPCGGDCTGGGTVKTDAVSQLETDFVEEANDTTKLLYLATAFIQMDQGYKAHFR